MECKNIQMLPTHGSAKEEYIFRQIEFVWLFDPIIKFSERENWSLDEEGITQQDYFAMRALNRYFLTFFLNARQEGTMAYAQEQFAN